MEQGEKARAVHAGHGHDDVNDNGDDDSDNDDYGDESVDFDDEEDLHAGHGGRHPLHRHRAVPQSSQTRLRRDTKNHQVPSFPDDNGHHHHYQVPRVPDDPQVHGVASPHHRPRHLRGLDTNKGEAREKPFSDPDLVVL